MYFPGYRQPDSDDPVSRILPALRCPAMRLMRVWRFEFSRLASTVHWSKLWHGNVHKLFDKNMKTITKTAINAAMLVVLLVSASASAGGFLTPPTTTSHNETRAYVGVQWFTGETSLTKPNLVLGIRSTRTAAADNRVTGPDLTLTYSLEKSQFDALRLGYLNGKCNFLGTAGVGFSFKKSTFLAFAGAVGPFSKVFGELDSNLDAGAGLELNTQKCAGDAETTPLLQ
jgi:hypothetical protein